MLVKSVPPEPATATRLSKDGTVGTDRMTGGWISKYGLQHCCWFKERGDLCCCGSFVSPVTAAGRLTLLYLIKSNASQDSDQRDDAETNITCNVANKHENPTSHAA